MADKKQQDDGSLEKENAKLRLLLAEYKGLDEDLAARRIFEKARGTFMSWITLNGFLIVVATIVGFEVVTTYLKSVADTKVLEFTGDKLEKEVQAKIDVQVASAIGKAVPLAVDKARPEIVDRVYQRYLQLQAPLAGQGPGLSPATPPGQPSEAAKAYVDWSEGMPAVADQGNEGSSAGFALANTLTYYVRKATGEMVTISARDIYNESRIAEDALDRDGGMVIKDGIDFLRQTGAVDDLAWPYHPGEFAEKPPLALSGAKRYRIKNARSVVTLEEMKVALQNGPVAGGFSIFASGFGATLNSSGIFTLPKANETVVGGHAVSFVGYDDAKQLIKIQQDWGSTWGDHGYGYLPYDYFRQYSNGCWTFQYADN